MKPEQQAFNEAVVTGNLPAIADALALGADINFCDHHGQTPLIYVLRCWYEDPDLSEQERLSIVRFLIEHGTNVNPPGDDGCRPLLYSAFSWYDSIFEYLLSCGADPNPPVGSDPETLFDWLIWEWRSDFFDVDEPEDSLEGEDDVAWLSRLATKYGKPQPRILQMLKAVGAKRHSELHR